MGLEKYANKTEHEIKFSLKNQKKVEKIIEEVSRIRKNYKIPTNEFRWILAYAEENEVF